jgi:basic membrane lipoprotein Med (substrate-binding protein (PBP1-ABC) superfamily)
MQIKSANVFIATMVAAALAGCAGGKPSATPAASPTAEPALTSTPTPEPFALVVAPDPPPSSAGRLALQAVEKFISDQGWELRMVTPGEGVLQAPGNPRLIAAVESGLGPAVAAAAQANPGIRFVAVGETGVQPQANLLVVGGDNFRADQVAFMAGLLAGVENRNDYVGWIGEAETTRGKIYKNGFRHGIRYVCPRCYVFVYELAAGAGAGDGLAVSGQLMTKYADTASAISGEAGDAALSDLARNGVRVAGAAPDFYSALFGGGSIAGAKFVLGGPAFRPDLLLADLLPRFAGGETFDQAATYSLENGGLEFAPFPNDWISPGRREFLQKILDELASGRLDIGINPQTGEEL